MGDWFSIGSGALGVLGGITSSIFSNNAVNKQLKAQHAENEKNRMFNENQARLAREYNSRMVAEQRAYDSPAALMARLKDAGIHPALAYSNGAPLSDIGVGSTGMAAMSAGSVGTGLPDFSGIGSLGSNLAGTVDSAAHAGLTRTDTELNQVELAYKAQYLEKGLVKGDAEIRMLGSYADLQEQYQKQSVEFTKLLVEQTINAKQEYNKLMAETQSIGVDIDLKKLHYDELEKTTQERVQAMCDQYHITREEALSAAKFFAVRLNMMAAQAYRDNETGRSLKLENDFTQKLQEEANEYLKQYYPELAKSIKLKNEELQINVDWLAWEKGFGMLKDAAQVAVDLYTRGLSNAMRGREIESRERSRNYNSSTDFFDADGHFMGSRHSRRW